MLPDGTWGTLTAMAIVLLAYGCVFGAGEIVRRCGVSGETTRTGVHVASGVIGLLLPCLFHSPGPVVVLALAFACSMSASKALGVLGCIHDVRRPTVGAQMFPIGVAAAFLLSGGHAPAYPIAILALGLGDPSASIVGRRMGRHTVTVFGTQRSVEGSAAAFLVSAAVAGPVLLGTNSQAAPLLATPLMVGLAVAITEALSPRGLDNLSIPVVAATVVDAAFVPWSRAAVLLVLMNAFILCVVWGGWIALCASRAGRLRWRV